ncbi:MAG: hypothetical protein JNK58_08495 [Phycisphaerae bacterium]|nr:hypothetical protein [Phycisphaerae bacterium]
MNSKVKVIIAVICLAVAGVVVAMNTGLIGGGKPKRTGTTTNTAQTGATGTDAKGTEDSDTPPTAGQLKKDNF